MKQKTLNNIEKVLLEFLLRKKSIFSNNNKNNTVKSRNEYTNSDYLDYKKKKKL